MGHLFKKQFGQNFLKSARYPRILVKSLELSKGDVVVEIGPGDGAVTKLLLETNAQVVCVELDYDLIPKLIKRFNEYENFHIIHGNIMDLDFREIIKPIEEKLRREVNEFKVIGSLPYNISKQIINKCNRIKAINENLRILKMSFIVQDEVAKEYVSKAPKATFLSNYIQVFGNAKKFDSIPASQFYPKPKVDGGILVITPHEELLENSKEILKFLKIGFSSPRKTLRNNLKNSGKYDVLGIDTAFNELDLRETTRPSEITFMQWLNLFEQISRQ